VCVVAQLTHACHAACKADQVEEVDRAYAEENFFEYVDEDFNVASVRTQEDCTLLCKKKKYTDPKWTDPTAPYGGQCIGYEFAPGLCRLLVRDSGIPDETRPIREHSDTDSGKFYSVAACP
jgi:hypothetical protein